MSPSTETRDNRGFAAEIKYLLTPARADQIREWARAHVGADPNAGGEMGDSYRITSIYFDTANFDVFHRNGSFKRAKYRIRRYDLGEIAFLERKLRTRKMLSKRRSIIAIDELDRLSDGEPESGWPGYWFHRRILARGLRPICQISYDRTARVSMTSCGPIRLTVDRNLRVLPLDGIAFDGARVGTPLLQEHHILELKFIRHMPAKFKSLVEEFALNAQPLSKYRLAVTALGCVTGPVMEEDAEDVREAAYA